MREADVRKRYVRAGVLGGSLLCLSVYLTLVSAQGVPSSLTGSVTSKAEGLMEGVVVIAQREDSSVLTAVTTDASGQYRFPRNRVEPGKYTIAIRAAGYMLPGTGPTLVEVGSREPSRLDLALRESSRDELAHQMTSVDWWNSMPGTDRQKELLVRTTVNCGFCHEMERVMRSRHTADQFLSVIARMSTYAADNSSACGTRSALECDATTSGRVQVQRKQQPVETLSADDRELAQYLASVNLSGGRTTWDFPLKPMPRPKGRGTRAVVTVFPVPRQPSVIHDLAVDQQGNVWWGDSGWGYLGKFEPKTGTFSEIKAPQHWPDPEPGTKRIVGIQDVEVDASGRVWAVVGFLGKKGLAHFDPKTEKWAEFDMPAPVWAFLPSFHKGQRDTTWTSGQILEPGEPPQFTAFRLNAELGRVDVTHPIKTATAFCYQVSRDADDNFLCNDFMGSNIVMIDVETGENTFYPTPTPKAAPRRGRFDDEGRLYWFAEFWGDKIGLFDQSTKSIREFAYSTKYMSAYAAAPDQRGEGWGSSTGSDRVVRVNPETGEMTEYLMPVYYDARKVVVDPSTPTPTIWLPNKNLSQLIRIEPQD